MIMKTNMKLLFSGIIFSLTIKNYTTFTRNFCEFIEYDSIQFLGSENILEYLGKDLNDFFTLQTIRVDDDKINLSSNDRLLALLNDGSNLPYILVCLCDVNKDWAIKLGEFLNGEIIDFNTKSNYTFVKLPLEISTRYFNLTPEIKYGIYKYHKAGPQTQLAPFDNIKVQRSQLGKDFATTSGVQITNENVKRENKAYISKGDKKLPFEVTLNRYFYSDKSLDYINNAVIKHKYDKTSEDQKKDPLFKDHLKLKNIATAVAEGIKDNRVTDTLEKSKILAIYGVLKDEQGKHSIAWVLAKNKETGKNFHWLIDLKDDISVLLR